MLTGFQYKASIAILKIDIKDLSKILKLNEATLLRLKKTKNFDYLRCHRKNMLLITSYFHKHNITYPDKDSIQLNEINNLDEEFALTRFHLVSARIATGLNQNQLSKILRISPGTISLLEKLNNIEKISTRKVKNSSLINFFNHLGIVFNKNNIVTLRKDPQLFLDKTKM